MDEGVDINHPNLKYNIWVNTDEVTGNGVDDDRNGYVDDRNGNDFANDDASVYDPDPISGKGDEHGTHVAGTIAAQENNGARVAGVNWRAAIMPLKWADASGHLFVAAAGNEGANNDATPNYPSNYNSANIISVAATDNALASFSSFGANTVDIAAPGVNILSTLPGNRYGSYSGTSMATPHVTGVAALIKSQRPTSSDEQLKAQILQFAAGKTNLQGKVATGGRLNAYASLTQTAGQCGTHDHLRETLLAHPRPDADGDGDRARRPHRAL